MSLCGYFCVDLQGREGVRMWVPPGVCTAALLLSLLFWQPRDLCSSVLPLLSNCTSFHTALMFLLQLWGWHHLMSKIAFRKLKNNSLDPPMPDTQNLQETPRHLPPGATY